MSSFRKRTRLVVKQEGTPAAEVALAGVEEQELAICSYSGEGKLGGSDLIWGLSPCAPLIWCCPLTPGLHGQRASTLLTYLHLQPGSKGFLADFLILSRFGGNFLALLVSRSPRKHISSESCSAMDGTHPKTI